MNRRLTSVPSCPKYSDDVQSDSSYREREKTAGEEVEAKEEHGDTAIDDADEADEWKPPVGDG